MKKKKRKNKKIVESPIELTIRLAKMRGGRCTLVITDKKKYKRKKKHKGVEE